MLKAYTRAVARINSLRTEEDGATAVEYGLLVALIAAVIIAVVILLGGEIRAAFQTIVDGIPGGAPAAP
ncbi:pilus assembly protein Flp/PilA [Agromyces ramosus]|uniref:Pilus assembly protein Flp/PilA n=1 Tax=Agromyces ramosus TaxID=33879 RepID=A0A4Q7MPK0_9MICO|nr:Flp family type IVb pilin [Agromyces ramosus]RZS68639.1 pilus assembly protein Flp/PilA [Agromyces ramosus]